jgi:Tfp pilus assembly protein PilO
MNGLIDRQLIAQVVIIVAVCAGGWMTFVEPRIDELHRLQATIAEASSNPLPMGQESIEQMADQFAKVRDRFRRIEVRNDFAGDSTRIYGLIMDLAEEHGVTVQRLDPGSDGRSDDDEEAPVRFTTLDMTIEGGYEQVAVFLEAVEALDGFIRPVTLSVTPREEEGRSFVEARFACQAVRFTLPEELTAMVGGADADD